MISFNGNAACRVRVATDDEIYNDLPKREGSRVRFCLYYRGFLVWKEARNEWAYSKAKCDVNAQGIRTYRGVGDRISGTAGDLFYTRREAIEAIDRKAGLHQ